MDAHQQIVLVTGATRGIGRGVAERFARLGMTVLAGARDLARGQEIAASIDGDIHALAVDVTDQASVTAAAVHIQEQFGRLDVLVNNAGITGSGPVNPAEAYDQMPSTVDLDIVRAVFETNVFGVIRVTNAMLPLLRRSPAARIVNMTSHGGSLTLASDLDGPMAGLLASAAYLPSKSALNALTVQYAKELRGDGIVVNAVAPGFVDTDSNNHTGVLTVAQAAAVVVGAAGHGSTAGFISADGPLPW